MKKIISIVTIMVMLFLALPVSALTLVTDNGIYQGTPEEIRALQSDVLGAIVMKEGQKDATQSFIPDTNNTRDLGSNALSFKDVYASGTIRTGQIVATSSVLSLIGGQKICIADGTNCAGIASATFFVNSGTNWYMTTTTPVKVGLGDTTPDAFWEVAGDQNVLQSLITGFANQTQDLFHVASSTNNVVFSIASDGNLAASGTLELFATSTFKSTAGIRASSTLQVSGNSNLYGTLAVTGATTLTGAATLSSTLGVTGATTLSSTLDVTGATTLSSTLAVTGATTLTGLLTPNGGISTSTLDSVVIGGSSRSAGSFTTLLASSRLNASSTVQFDGVLSFPTSGGVSTSTLDNMTLGIVTPTRASTTLFSVMGTGYFGGTATSTITGGAAATSTFTSSVAINEASTTSTLYIGRTGSAGQGGCIVLASGDGSGNLYLYAAGGTLQLSTSTVAKSCF